MANISESREILRLTKKQIFKKANVVGTGIGYKVVNGKPTNEISIICSVGNKVSLQGLSKKDLIPSDIDGVPTDVFPTGTIYAQESPTQRFRPAPGGVSIGHKGITAGTFGCLVEKNGRKFILSNNHVLANSNDASIGDIILQPGPYDNGDLQNDSIAKLYEFTRIYFDGMPLPGGGDGSDCPFAKFFGILLNAFAASVGSQTRLLPARVQGVENLVDAAIAKPLNEYDILDEILNIGKPNGIAEGSLGTQVKKMGRTTGLTQGTIHQIDATVKVNYGANKVATFTDQLVAGAMSQGGDSGSTVLNEHNRIVGLLFAGSNTTTIINRIQNVISALNIVI